VWYDHYLFFRQFGLTDTLTAVLNLALLFVVMFYVYPLKFLFTVFVGVGTGAPPIVDGKPAIERQNIPDLLMIYGAGFVAVYAVFTLMYLNAYRQREALELNELERFDTLSQLGSTLLLVGIGVVSILLASFRSPPACFASAGMYWMIGIAMAVYFTISGRRRRRLEQRHLEVTAAPDRAPA